MIFDLLGNLVVGPGVRLVVSGIGLRVVIYRSSKGCREVVVHYANANSGISGWERSIDLVLGKIVN